MKLVKVKPEYYKLLKTKQVDREIMENETGRPCVLLVDLIYKGRKREFVVPLRSNISPTATKQQYLPLPPNSHTKPHHHHGVHYVKLFPIVNTYIDRYKISDNSFLVMLKNILDKKESEIISACKYYLKEYGNGNKHPMTPQIDQILNILDAMDEEQNKNH